VDDQSAFFAITTQVLTATEWTPSVLEKWQQRLLDTLAAGSLR